MLMLSEKWKAKLNKNRKFYKAMKKIENSKAEVDRVVEAFMQSNDVVDPTVAEAIQFLLNIESEKSKQERKAKDEKKFSTKMKEKEIKKEEKKIDKAALKTFNACTNWDECWAPWLKVDKEMRRAIEERAHLGMPKEMVEWYERTASAPGWKREFSGTLSNLNVFDSCWSALPTCLHPLLLAQMSLTRRYTTASLIWGRNTFSSVTPSEKSSNLIFNPIMKIGPLSYIL